MGFFAGAKCARRYDLLTDVMNIVISYVKVSELGLFFLIHGLDFGREFMYAANVLVGQEIDVLNIFPKCKLVGLNLRENRSESVGENVGENVGVDVERVTKLGVVYGRCYSACRIYPDFSKYINLISISISCVYVNDLGSLIKCVKLRRVSITNCFRINNLDFLKELKLLESVELDNMEEELDVLCDCIRLKSICLRKWCIDEHDVSVLAKCAGLRVLKLGKCYCRNLRLKCANLKYLSMMKLEGTNMSKLYDLRECTNLRKVKIVDKGKKCDNVVRLDGLKKIVRAKLIGVKLEDVIG